MFSRHTPYNHMGYVVTYEFVTLLVTEVQLCSSIFSGPREIDCIVYQ